MMVEARSVLRRRRFHRAEAHLVVSAMRHRAAELGDRVRCVRAGTYRDGPREALGGNDPSTVCHPTSHAALRLGRSLGDVAVLPARGFPVPHDAFRACVHGRGGGGRGRAAAPGGLPPLGAPR
ncbi:hypothetical protein [Streptomyces sp. NPDC048710]|uniref:hypothetical protein n=1 Tax=unclassified Streptomyces TaxID=2593676 RepID=UPI00371FE49D